VIYTDCYEDYNWRNNINLKKDHALVHRVADNQINSRVWKQNVTVTISTMSLHLQNWTLLGYKTKATQSKNYSVITIEKQILLTLTLARCRSTPYISRRFAWSKKLNSASAGVCPLQKGRITQNLPTPITIYIYLKTHKTKFIGLKF
jgi:hypothetical protein